MEKNGMRQRGRKEACSWTVEGHLPVSRLAGAIRADLSALEGLCRRLEAMENADCPAGRWLLDNRWLFRRTGTDAIRHSSSRTPLPALSEGLLRIRQVGAALAREEQLTPEGVRDYLEGIQETDPLTEEELEHFPAALVGGLLSALRREGEAVESLLRRGEDPQPLENELRDLFARLRQLRFGSLAGILEEVSMAERFLRQDPAGVYPKMDPGSRSEYRKALCRRAKREKRSQMACAQQLLEQARKAPKGENHIGRFLFSPPKSSGDWYFSLQLLFTTALSLWAGFALGRWWGIVLFLLPVSELVKNGLDFFLLRLVGPRPVFRLELKQGVPPEGKTLCVIAALLTGPDCAEEYANKLERYALANRGAGEQVCYGLLADLPDRNTPMTQADRALLDDLQRKLEALNQKHGGRFALFFRAPVYHEAEKNYLGKERKRGAILELTRYLRGHRSSLKLLAGEEHRLAGTKFLLVLDGDTILTVNAVTELVGAMLHPLNRPVIDRQRRVVTAGYGILQPRVETELSSASASVFAKLFGGLGGLDPYGGATSDVYHDLFDQASFLGKGLIDIEAFGVCMDGRFPENRILSHDLLEGSYLRTGWVSQVELMDSFPSSPLSWLGRYHRWIRGDWQLLPWLLPRVRDETGERVENPISRLAKWKIADNLRRSLAPPATVLALVLGMLLGGPIFTIAALVALASAAVQLLYAMAELLYRHGAGSFRRYHAGRYAGFSGALLRTGAQILFLPVQGWTALSAVCTALWRMLVSHRHLLDWVPSAQGNAGGLWAFFRRFLPSILLGLAGLLWAVQPLGQLLGLGWLISPLLFRHWGKARRQIQPVSDRDRAFLLHEGALIWRYYDQWLRPEYHYLIPDNVQLLPDKGPALRTSPTNLGLALLSCLSAVDLKLTFPRHALELVEQQLTALEGLEKWHGHLYNWYDIETGKPLTPRYVSTVDSGNLCGDLIALARGLEELDRPDLASRAKKLADEMDFRLLFDPVRQLFYVGYDWEHKIYPPNHYDLMASEARMTSYLAVARGEVPPRHWRQLSRALVQKGRYTGMGSWSGTMFEYLMPQLLLPWYEDSLLSETLAFCLRQQRRLARTAGIPWGISESAYYALDREQNYQYKAHGVSSLGLQRGLAEELVVSPYASYLALPVEPGPAIANLRRLRDLGAEGRYGLYEALDYTPARGGDRQNPLIIQSWMAHHLGMSLVALDNCLREGVWQRRLFRDAAMAAAQELLQEKIPVGAPVVKPEPLDPPHLSLRSGKPWKRQGTGFDRSNPVWGILSNGGYSVFLSAGGRGASRAGESTILHPEGVQISVTLEDKIIPVFPREAGGPELIWQYSSGGARLTWQGPELILTQEVLVDRLRNGECRSITVTARQALEGHLTLLLRPVLSPWDAYAAHPAFSRMCVESRYIGSGVQFARKPGRGKPQPVLTVLWEELEAGWTTNRERYLTTGSLRHTGREGVVLDPCLALELPLALTPGKKRTFRIALAAGARENSLLMAQSLLALRKPAPSPLTDQLARHLEGGQITAAFVLLARLLEPHDLGREGQVLGQPSLWPFGLSGDLPIVTCTVPEGETAYALSLAGLHRLLARLGYAFDLALLLPEAGEYRQAIRTGLTRALEQAGLADRLGQPGGIHLISGDRKAWAPILGMAALNLQPGDRLTQPEQFRPAPKPQAPQPKAGNPPVWRWEGDTFILKCQGSLPPLRWSQLLVSDRFGWRCDEAGTGHLWYRNAQMEQLTPWQNDPIAQMGPEELFCTWAGGACSLFARQDGLPVTVTYGPGYARWEKQAGQRTFSLTAFVPVGKAVRLFLLSCTGGLPEDRLIWTITPKLAHRDSQMPWVRWQREGEQIRVENPAGSLAGEAMLLAASSKIESADFTQGQGMLTFSTGASLVLAAGMAPMGEWGNLLSWEGASRALEETEHWWRRTTGSLRVETPEPALNHYLSFWGRYQVLAGRLFGRSGLYQCGGAYGFRDQLQDVLALIPFVPNLAKEQIERAARHQFREGDVLHWWHPTPGASGAQGVRTRISDDLLWLPYVLSRWCRETGDESLLREELPWLEGRPLAPEEHERYEHCPPTRETASLYRHAVQAIECVLNRGIGDHGLCLMGTGDWNDGMDRVGAKGRGESVWLTWFLALTLRQFVPLCRAMEEPERAQRYQELTGQLTAAAHRTWDGGWYLRAYDDEGNPVGSHRNRECAVDSISQSFSVLAPGPDPALARQAVLAAAEQLYDREHQLAKLLWPPFAEEGDPGYIRSYPGGLRENGGQYTHAACWLALALLDAGETELGAQLLHDLLPENHPNEIYRAEPFVLAGDVYAAPDQEGRGGWSWYTGAASWYCQTATASLLGLRLEAGRLVIQPKIPNSWPGYEAVWQGEGFTLHIQVTRGLERPLTLDGAFCPEGIPLYQLSGTHLAELVLPEGPGKKSGITGGKEV